MIYYRVDFVAAKLISRPAKKFVTEEKAKQHVKRVLGMANDTGLLSESHRSCQQTWNPHLIPIFRPTHLPPFRSGTAPAKSLPFLTRHGL